jgi:hypothetical protein
MAFHILAKACSYVAAVQLSSYVACFFVLLLCKHDLKQIAANRQARDLRDLKTTPASNGK